jgi:hypothetical protein
MVLSKSLSEPELNSYRYVGMLAMHSRFIFNDKTHLATYSGIIIAYNYVNVCKQHIAEVSLTFHRKICLPVASR